MEDMCLRLNGLTLKINIFVVHQIVRGEPLSHPQPVGRMWPAGFPLNCQVLSSSVEQSVIFKPYNDTLIQY